MYTLHYRGGEKKQGLTFFLKYFFNFKDGTFSFVFEPYTVSEKHIFLQIKKILKFDKNIEPSTLSFKIF